MAALSEGAFLPLPEYFDDEGIVENWCNDNTRVIPLLVFKSLSPNPPKDALNKFESLRKDTHSMQIEQILLRKRSFEYYKNSTIKNLAKLTEEASPVVKKLCYDDQRHNMAVRQLAFLQLFEKQLTVSRLNLEYSYYLDMIERCNLLLDFFVNQEIPKQIICRARNQTLKNDVAQVVIKEKKQIKAVLTAIKAYKDRIKAYPKPLWTKDMGLFMLDLVSRVSSHIDSELSYVVPSEGEVSLSRALFNNLSTYRGYIDETVNQIESMPSDKFIEVLVKTCYSVMPSSVSTVFNHQSMALLMLFRAIFNRCFEKHDSLFIFKESEYTKKVNTISHMQASLFPLPKQMITGDYDNISIRELFHNSKYYFSAAQFLNQAIFNSNPIDALYDVHKTLVAIHKAALINRLGGSNARMEDVNQLLCFDDLFSLFFGTLMASDVPDIFGLADFIGSYAPKSSLSPSFEYAHANMEALVVHCINIDLEKLENSKKN